MSVLGLLVVLAAAIFVHPLVDAAVSRQARPTGTPTVSAPEPTWPPRCSCSPGAAR
ncbi:MAG: hypothetical protein ACR2JO_03205 [Mycobacteriales bacterium]